MRLFVLVTDAFGGKGGIAKFNRDLLTALCSHPATEEVVALPRVMSYEDDNLPERLTYVPEAAGGQGHYIRHVLQMLKATGPVDGVVCGHLYMLPLALLAARIKGAPLLLIVHGIEAWGPTQTRLAGWLTRQAAQHVDAFVAVSDVTRRRFAAWLGLDPARGAVVPNCIEAERYGPGPKRPDLVERYGLDGKTVLMTLGRLSAQERYKGFDEVMEALPALAERVPDLAYLICGSGDDRARLEQKADVLGVRDRVVFAGYVPESEKADHYRLADAFVMPGSGEGFGIVYLEALACGVPVVASTLDASREAVRDGELGAVVDPRDPADLRRGILQALAAERQVPAGLAYFSFDQFRNRWHRVVDETFAQDVPAISSSA